MTPPSPWCWTSPHLAAIQAATVRRGKVIARVECVGTGHKAGKRLGLIYDATPHPLFLGSQPSPAAQRALPPLKGDPAHVGGTVGYAAAQVAWLIGWEGDLDPRCSLHVRCRNHGPLELTDGRLIDAVADYRRTGKLRRIRLHP